MHVREYFPVVADELGVPRHSHVQFHAGGRISRGIFNTEFKSVEDFTADGGRAAHPNHSVAIGKWKNRAAEIGARYGSGRNTGIVAGERLSRDRRQVRLRYSGFGEA